MLGYDNGAKQRERAIVLHEHRSWCLYRDKELLKATQTLRVQLSSVLKVIAALLHKALFLHAHPIMCRPRGCVGNQNVSVAVKHRTRTRVKTGTLSEWRVVTPTAQDLGIFCAHPSNLHCGFSPLSFNLAQWEL